MLQIYYLSDFERTATTLTFAVDEVPGIALLRSTNPEAYKEIKSAAREADKALGLTRKTKTKEEKEEVYIPLYSVCTCFDIIKYVIIYRACPRNLFP